MSINHKAKIFFQIFTIIYLFQFSYSIAAHSDNVVATVTQIKKSIVAIGTTQARRSPLHVIRGTGFVVSDGRHVVTNAHVVSVSLDRSNREKWVVFVVNGDKEEVRQVEIVKLLPTIDLALLKFEGDALQPLQIGASSEVKEGQLLYFTGYPLATIFGLHPATHHALLASIAPLIIPVNNAKQLSTRAINQLRDPYDIFQLDGIAYPGGSGSPLYAPGSGKVIGVISMSFIKKSKEHGLNSPSGIVFAIPSEHIAKLFR